MKITMYELLGMMKDGKAPKKIKYKNDIYEYEDYDYFGVNRGYFFDRYNVSGMLNEEVEILEEEKKIPEKLEQIMSKRGKYNSIDELAEEVFKAFETIDDVIINQNKIIDYLKSKGDE